jgi:hypothetical protein
MASIARGFRMEAAMRRQPSVNAFCCTAFIGLPWPKKTDGMGIVTDILLALCCR